MRWTAEEEDFLRNNLDKTNDWIAAQLNRTVDSIQHRCILLGISKKYNQLKHQDKSVLFSDKEMGYCLGVFASDGCLTEKKNRNGSTVKRFSLTFAIKDVDFLISVFKLLTGDIVEYRIRPPTLGKTDKVSYDCTLKNFIEVAERFGITRNKSKTLNVKLDDKSEIFKYYFLRGVIDGDGHIPTTYGYRVSIVSASHMFIECLLKNFNGHIRKRNYGDYWDFFLVRDEEYKLPREPYMLDRKSKRLEARIAFEEMRNQTNENNNR